MSDLPAWAIVCLGERCTPEELVAKAKSLGVSADVTRDGIQFGGGFLAWVEPEPISPRVLDQSLLDEDPDVGAARLVISGGTNDLAREQHRQPEQIRQMTRDMAAQLGTMGLPQVPNATIESAASKKIKNLTELIHRLSPLATAVVLPKANNIVLESEQLHEMATPYLEEGGYHFPLWVYLKVRQDEDCPLIASEGMWPFGLPDVALPLMNGLTTAQAAKAIGAVQREMVAEGLWFEDGATFATEIGEVRMHARWDGLFLMPVSWPETDAVKKAIARFGRQRAYKALLGDNVMHHIPAKKDGIAIEHVLRSGQSGMALTNGLSDKKLPGSTAADENEWIELCITAPQMGPWATNWLLWAMQYLAGHDGSRPIRPFDRLVAPTVTAGIAGVILWPMGTLAPARDGEPTASLWELMPFTPEELARFRAEPGTQGAWIDERLERGDIPEMQKRWTAASTAR